MLQGKKCVECGGYVPPYLNYLCEDCWKEMLNKKLMEDKEDQEQIELHYREINVGIPESRWF
jgi:NMD protein affecting ribosome stability and mRNA decay